MGGKDGVGQDAFQGGGDNALTDRPNLDPQDWSQFRAQGHRMLDDMLDHMRDLRRKPVWQPMSDEERQRFRSAVPTTPISLHAHWGCTAGGLDWVRGYCDYRLGAGATKRHWGIDASVVGTTLGHADAARVAAVDANEVWRVARTAVVLGVTFQY